jgi:MFS family permease
VLRSLQAIGGMLMTPTSLAIITAHFSGAARGKAIALWSAFSALTTTFAPIVGGVLIDALGWRFVFWINIPLAMVVVFATLAHVTETRSEKQRGKLDVLGAVLAVLGFGGLTYAMLEHAILAFVAGLVFLTIFVVHELRTDNPLIPVQLFKNRTFGAINLATFFLYGALGGLMYEMPFALIQARHFTALEAAFGTMPLGICIVIFSRFGSKAAQRFGTRAVLTGAPLLVTCGMLAIALLNHQASYFIAFLPGLLLFGIGMGFIVAPLTNGVMSAADPAHVGIASGISNTVSRISGLLVVAAVIPVLAFVYNGRIDHALATMHATTTQIAQVNQQREKLGGAHYGDSALQKISIESFESGFGSIAFFCAILVILAAVTDFAGIDESQLRNT